MLYTLVFYFSWLDAQSQLFNHISMKMYFFFLFAITSTNNLFSQNATYKAEYDWIIKNTSKLINDSSHESSDIKLEMKIHYSIIANKKYALLKATITDINYPLSLEERSDEIFIIYETHSFYRLNKSKGIIYTIDEFINKKENKLINKYPCELFSPSDSSLENINIWVSKDLPWYINPGMFTSQKLYGVVKIETDKSELILDSVSKIKFNFSILLKKARKLKLKKLTKVF